MTRFRSWMALAFCSTSIALGQSENHLARLEPRLPTMDVATSVRHGHTGDELSLAGLAESLSHADIVFLGESHTDDSTHRLQLYLYEALLRLKEGKVVLGLEMFHRDQQAELDSYLAGETDEQEFSEAVDLWGNYREAYRPLIERAKRDGCPVVATNFPKSLLRKVASDREEAIKSLSREQRRLLPAELLPNTDAYWNRVDNAIRSHAAMMPSASGDPSERLYSVQSLWDNSMGDACVEALRANPGSLVLHLNGGFHSSYWDGAVRQAMLRAPDATIRTVSIIPTTSNPRDQELVGVPVADYLVTVEWRATNADQGFRTVAIGGDLKYVLHRPEAASLGEPLPLIIWLPDEGLNAKESLPYCRTLFGDDAILAVVEPPYRERGRDLATGGRWYWPDTFAEDTGAMVGGIERIVEYVASHDAVAADKVCLVGEGAGGTVVAAVAARTDRIGLRALAVRPTGYTKLKDLPLLLPQHYRDGELPSRSLAVLAGTGDRSWWTSELDAVASTGVSTEWISEPTDPWRFETALKEAVFGSGESEPTTESGPTRYSLRVASESPRAWLWARIQASSIASSTGIPTSALADASNTINATEISTSVESGAAMSPGVIPRCPGPFGGTTVLLLPADSSKESIDRWQAIEQEDPLAKASRFYRVRVATLGERLPLPEVLATLREKNRTNVLIVPACFYADDAMLSAALSATRRVEGMTLHWMPGLGGRVGAVQAP